MDNFYKFLQAEIKYINESKWYEGERTGKDPGLEYVERWAETHAQEFREKWNKSLCKKCANGHVCGNKLKNDCASFTTSPLF